MKPLRLKGKTRRRPLPAAGKGVGIPYTDGFSLKKVRALFKRHHHLEDWSEKFSVLRTARFVSANKSKGFLNETVKV